MIRAVHQEKKKKRKNNIPSVRYMHRSLSKEGEMTEREELHHFFVIGDILIVHAVSDTYS